MIKFHYHNFQGIQCCHIYSDNSLEELYEWAEKAGIPSSWVMMDERIPHIDLWGRKLKLLDWADKNVVGHREFGFDLMKYLAQKRQERSAADCLPPPAGD